tara:strand:+ start:566 stop:697 length:132 start_codon:yes stop_codon:yes gene_type:complete
MPLTVPQHAELVLLEVENMGKKQPIEEVWSGLLEMWLHEQSIQ